MEYLAFDSFDLAFVDGKGGFALVKLGNVFVLCYADVECEIRHLFFIIEAKVLESRKVETLMDGWIFIDD